jgi:GT2 family glycosyltransferase
VATSAPLTIAVVICTYRRVESLARCLEALTRQMRSPDDVIVVVRETDLESRAFLASRVQGSPPIRVAVVRTPGLVAARNMGLEMCRSDIVAMTDDDAVPHPNWVSCILEHFEHDPSLGGLGGRDRCHNGVQFADRREPVVGRLQWFGRAIGHHQFGFGPPREVDLFKGANMSYRYKAIANMQFDVRLRGSGAQPNDDMSFSLALKRAGWKLIYDPQILVDHYEGPREEIRYYALTIPVKDVDGFRNLAFNEVVARWDHLSVVRRVVFLAWSMAVGVRICPGLVQAIRFTPTMGWASWRRFWIAQQGIAAASWFLLRQSPAFSDNQTQNKMRTLGT